MEQLSSHMENLCINSLWKSKLDDDLHKLSKYYAQELYENVCFVPYESFDQNIIKHIVKYLETDNHARTLLSEKIKELYPDIFINNYDVDSIMDYYINALQLI